jgi:glycogen operon protein
MHLLGVRGDEDLCLLVNAHWEEHRFELPHLVARRTWHRAVDTALEAPHDIEEPGSEPPTASQANYRVAPRSVVVLVGRPA